MGGLLISSPKATVNYHCDITNITLWHLRGKKRVFIYPNQPPYLKTEDVQRITIGDGIENIDYDKTFESAVQSIDLEPGMMVAWPHLSPHRVDNLEGINVSLTLESLSAKSRTLLGAQFFDGFINRTFGTQLVKRNPSLPARYIKTAISFVIKALRLHRKFQRGIPSTVSVELSKEDCVEPVRPKSA